MRKTACRWFVLSLLLVAASVFADKDKTVVPSGAAAGSKAASHITAGIEHHGMGHWDVAKTHFTEAEQADL